jgi:DNA-binding XRE family transcriptional regulator
MNKLAAYRKLAGLTQEDVRRELGCSPVTYSHKENGKSEFTKTEMIKITKLIQKKIPKITMHDIFFDEEVGKLLTS